MIVMAVWCALLFNVFCFLYIFREKNSRNKNSKIKCNAVNELIGVVY